MATPEDRLLADEDIGFTPPTPEQLTQKFGATQDRTAVIGQTTEPVRQGEPLREAFLFGEAGPPRPDPEEEEEDEPQFDLEPDELRDRLPERIQEKLGQFAEEDQERILNEMIGALQSEERGGDQAIPAIEELETRLGRRGPTSTPEGPDPGTGEIFPIPEERVGTGLEGFGDLLERGIQAVGGAVKDKAMDLFEGADRILRGEDEEFRVEDFPGIALRGSMVGVDLVEEAAEMAVDGLLLADEAEDSVMRGLVQGFITQPIDWGSDFVSASTGVETAEDEVKDRIEILLPEQSDNGFFQMTEEMVALGAGFVGSGKVLNQLGRLTGMGKVTDLRKLRGVLQRAGRMGVAEAVSVDPETPRMADWISSMNIPAVSDGFAMLDPDEDDSDAVARIKRGLEGVLLESTVEAMIGQWRVMHGLNRWIEAPGPAARAKALEQIDAGIDQFEKWRKAAPDAVAPGQRVKVTQAEDGVFEITRARVEDFVPPGFTRDPTAFGVEGESLTDVLEGGPDMVHVTTAKSAVQEEGLAARSEIGRSALGGGPSDKVSVVFDPQHAQRIQERLTLAVRAARGGADIDEVVRHYENTFRAADTPAPLAQSLAQRNPAFRSETVASDWDSFRSLVREEYGDNVGQLAIDLDFGADRAFRGLGGGPAEGSLQSVGILTDPEALSKIDPEEIGMVRVAAREGASPQRVTLESELRFDPQDVRVIRGGGGPAPGVTPDIPANQVVIRAQTRGQAESVAASLDQLLKHGRPQNANRFGGLSDEQADMVMRQTRAAVRRAQAEGTTVSQQIGASDFFNIKTLNTDESVAVVDAMARVMVDEMENAKGSVTIEQMRDEAETILQGFGNDELASVLTDRMEDFQGMHAWVLAAHSFMGDQMDQIGRATKKLGQAPGDRALRGQIREKLVGLFQMTNMLNGAESEAGRTLRAIKELTDDPELGERLGAAADDVSESRRGRTGPGDTPESVTTGIGEVTDEIEEVVKMEEGPGLLGQMGLTVDDLKSADADRKIRAAVMDADDETIDRMGAMISMAEHPREMLSTSKAFRIIKQGGAGNKAFSFFMNNILSGLRTQATIASSAITMGNFQPIAKIVGGQMLKALPGPRNGVGERLIRLGSEEMIGHQMYLQDGARMMGRALKAGHSFIGGRTTRRVAESTAGQAFTEWVPRWMGSVDEMIRQIRYRAIVRARAMEHYRGQGLRGDEMVRKAEEMVEHSFDPETGEALFKGMLDEATVATFSNPLGEASLSKKFANMVQRASLFRYIVPFTRAPSNLMTKAWEITPPFSFGKKTIRQSMVNSQEEAGRILGENFIGSMIAGFALWGSQHGFITGGGPVDKGMRNTWEQNHDRYSFHFENDSGEVETISYRRFEPFTIPLSVLADVTEGLRFMGPGIESGRIGTGQVAEVAITRFIGSALDRTYLTTLNDLILGTVGGQKWKFAQALSKTAVGLSQPYSSLMRSINPDQFYRDTRNVVEDWKANVPGLSETIPPRFNAFGEKILSAPTKKQGTMAQITDTFNPFRHRVREKSDVGEIMYKLRIGRAPKDPSLTVQAPNGSEVEYADMKDEGLKSSPDDKLPWVRFNEILRDGIPEEGLPPMKEAVSQALEDSDLNLEEHGGNDLFLGGPLASVIRPILSDYYTTAENIVRSEYPIIQSQFEAIQEARANAMSGQDSVRELDAIIDSVQRAARAEGRDESGDLPSFFDLD